MHKMKYLWKKLEILLKKWDSRRLCVPLAHTNTNTHTHMHTHSHPHTHTDTHMRTSTSPPEKLTFDLSTLLVTHTQEITSRPNERTQAQTDVSGTNWTRPVQRPTSNRSLLSTNNLGCLIRPPSSSFCYGTVHLNLAKTASWWKAAIMRHKTSQERRLL